MASNIASFQRSPVLLTGIALGTAGPTVHPADLIIPTVFTNKERFEYPVWDENHLIEHDANRPPKAEFREVDFGVSFRDGRMKRYGLKTSADEDELANADSLLRLRDRKILRAKGAVERSVAKVKTDFLLDPANHGTVIDATTAEFNVDSQTTIRAAYAALLATSSGQYNQRSIRLFLSDSSHQAALEDPIFSAILANTNHALADLELLADNWGWKRYRENVFSIPTNRKTEKSAPVTDAWGDTALMWIDTRIPGDFAATEWGEEIPFSWVTQNRGTAGVPFLDENKTTWNFPWTAHGVPESHTPTSSVLIINTVA